MIIFGFLACDQKKVELTTLSDSGEPYDTTYSINTSGYMDNGDLWTKWDCPDSRFFPPIDIKSWDKIRVVNGRLPTYKETINGTSILHYGKKNLDVKPYPMTLPKLAYYFNPDKQSEFHVNGGATLMTQKSELVVVVEIVQTAKDTIVGYRYLTGGCGGSLFHDFHFLTEEEVKKVVGQ